MRNSLVCAAVVLSAAAATSQTTSVSPAAMTNAYGAINNSIPWGPFVPTGNTIGGKRRVLQQSWLPIQ